MALPSPPGQSFKANYLSIQSLLSVYNSQDMMEATQMSLNRGMDKEDVIHIYHGILLSHQKERNNAICSNMVGPRECRIE